MLQCWANLYTGSLTSDQINNELTQFNPLTFSQMIFFQDYTTDAKYSSVRASLTETVLPVGKLQFRCSSYMEAATPRVDPVTTESIYEAMIRAGTSTQ